MARTNYILMMWW